MINTEGFSALVGLILPVVVELVKVKFADNRKASFAIALGSSFIVGAVATLLTKGFSIEELLGSAGAAFVASQAVYNLYWRGSRLENRLFSRFDVKASKKK